MGIPPYSIATLLVLPLMQQPREPELNFTQVKKEVNLVDLVLTLGYQHNRAKSGPDINKGKFHVFDYQGNPSLDQVIIYKAPSGDYLYFNRANDQDKGSVIDFLKHRIEHPRIAGIQATPGKNIWASIIENARRFLNLPAPSRANSPALQAAIPAVERGDQFIPDFLQKTTQLQDTRYLNSRGLTTETLTNGCFAGVILNHVHEGRTKDGQPYKFVNTAFPQLYNDKVVGLEIKAKGFKGQAANSQNSAALWLSNSGSKTRTLIISESAIDSLSHYQLRQPAYTMYASTSGNLTDNKVAEVRRLIDNRNLKTVKLAFDNDLQGHLFDTQLITGLSHASAPMRIERNLPGTLTVGIYSDQPQYFAQLREATRSYNEQVSNGYYQAGGAQATANTVLATELITAAVDAPNSYKFHVPKRLEALAFFNQALAQHYPMKVRLEMEKSRAHDWNDQLKESLRGQAVAAGQALEKFPISDLSKKDSAETIMKRGIRR